MAEAQTAYPPPGGPDQPGAQQDAWGQYYDAQYQQQYAAYYQQQQPPQQYPGYYDPQQYYSQQYYQQPGAAQAPSQPQAWAASAQGPPPVAAPQPPPGDPPAQPDTEAVPAPPPAPQDPPTSQVPAAAPPAYGYNYPQGQYPPSLGYDYRGWYQQQGFPPQLHPSAAYPQQPQPQQALYAPPNHNPWNSHQAPPPSGAPQPQPHSQPPWQQQLKQQGQPGNLPSQAYPPLQQQQQQHPVAPHGQPPSQSPQAKQVRPPAPWAQPQTGMVIRPQMSKAAVAAAKATATAGGSKPNEPSYLQVAKNGSSASAPDEPSPRTKANWPPSLRNYVERAFIRCKTPQNRKQIEVLLKQFINQAETQGELWSRNWETAPLPQLGNSQVEVQKAVQAARAKALAVAAQEKSGAVGKRKWGPKPVAKSDSSSDDDDPVAAQKRFRRAQRFGAGHADGAVPTPAKGKQNMRKRLQHIPMYSGGAGIVSKAHISVGPGEEIDWSEYTIQGTCQSLEKSYFRLTCAPDPSTVRPQPVLRKALDRLLRLLKEKKENFFYAQDQFKAMRQDCTVQHIRNAFTAEVYEAHARAALDYGEMGDYIQCQTKLNELYAEGIPGSKDEFTAYYLLHLVAHSKLPGEDGRLQRTALMDRLRRLSPEESQGAAVQHALQVRMASALDNQVAFFKLRATAPNLSGRLMDIQEEQMRFSALTMLTRAFKPTVPVPTVCRMLGFAPASHGESADDGGGLDKEYEEQLCECVEWLQAHGAVLKDIIGGFQSAKLNCKESADRLLIPEKEDACAHGDANLAVDDFMKRVVAQ
mmetsp:Transcript_22383/g.62057  ORF Transcript_22383/g.62057 Transcript_22383/m.62057 type:complete len:806 (-) Transcript_22383:370-2787(-)|eukprot:CAMPEP_0117674206 /NCGR_PEP_ID=MMETSP0804-20121206/14904_1 /TAXON_ID=1074897 /ORGANISM="Tetraselmis astigmatica, Strain CCMP880" /LENGTH=805 /DNA_ID=CAMNT_0005483039 /DNA_START=842 /DNA_END=3259 /DNA_ORIENTATION=+